MERVRSTSCFLILACNQDLQFIAPNAYTRDLANFLQKEEEMSIRQSAIEKYFLDKSWHEGRSVGRLGGKIFSEYRRHLLTSICKATTREKYMFRCLN